MPAVPVLTKTSQHLNLSQRQAQRAAFLLRLLFTDTAQRTAPESWAGARIGAASVLVGSVNKSNAACWFYSYSPYLYSPWVLCSNNSWKYMLVRGHHS